MTVAVSLWLHRCFQRLIRLICMRVWLHWSYYDSMIDQSDMLVKFWLMVISVIIDKVCDKNILLWSVYAWCRPLWLHWSCYDSMIDQSDMLVEVWLILTSIIIDKVCDNNILLSVYACYYDLWDDLYYMVLYSSPCSSFSKPGQLSNLIKMLFSVCPWWLHYTLSSRKRLLQI